MSEGRKKTAAVFFDFDGTLIDSLDLIKSSLFKVFKEMGLNWGDDEEVMGWIGRPLLEIARNFSPVSPEYFMERYQQYYHRDHDRNMTLFPGTREMLQDLKKSKLKTGIITSKSRPGTMKTIDFTGIGKYFDIIITATDVERHKPLPDPVYKALDLINLKAEEAIFVGDSRFDLEAGKAAGVRVLGVSWGISSVGELMRCDPEGILNKWDDLRLYIEP